MQKVDFPFEYDRLIKTPPAYAEVSNNNYEVQAVLDTETGLVNISIDNRYVGCLLCVKSWLKFNTISIKVNNRDYVFNRPSYLKHLNDLGISKISTSDYLLEIRKMDPKVLDQFTDRLWQHLGLKLRKQLTTDYHAALERNDFQGALNLVKQGVPLNNYFTFKSGLKTHIFLEEPTSTQLCKIHDESDPVFTKSDYDTLTCLSHSPLTALLSIPKNDIQAEKRAELLELLKGWGTSVTKYQKDYTVFVFVFRKNTKDVISTKAKSCKITKHIMS